MFGVETESGVRFSTRDQRKPIGHRVALNDVHLGPWLAPGWMPKHRPISGHPAAVYLTPVANLDWTSVQPCPLARNGLIELVDRGVIESRRDRAAVFHERNRMTEVGNALQERARSVDRIDYPYRAASQSCRIALGLLGEPAVMRPCLTQPALDVHIDRNIRIADRR